VACADDNLDTPEVSLPPGPTLSFSNGAYVLALSKTGPSHGSKRYLNFRRWNGCEVCRVMDQFLIDKPVHAPSKSTIHQNIDVIKESFKDLDAGEDEQNTNVETQHHQHPTRRVHAYFSVYATDRQPSLAVATHWRTILTTLPMRGRSGGTGTPDHEGSWMHFRRKRRVN